MKHFVAFCCVCDVDPFAATWGHLFSVELKNVVDKQNEKRIPNSRVVAGGEQVSQSETAKDNN